VPILGIACVLLLRICILRLYRLSSSIQFRLMTILLLIWGGNLISIGRYLVTHFIPDFITILLMSFRFCIPLFLIIFTSFYIYIVGGGAKPD
jgi:hypothetical protein